MTKKEFEDLDSKSKRRAAQKALAWFCVLTSVRFPFIDITSKEEAETVKIILGKYMNEELKEVENERTV
ncbi:hypothetical protein HLY09_26350 [Enterocloster bolteae]|jgi:hypothetical protein|uniref:hypothetical protein n=1 Tax=Enterocloster bolteae TaxID=208479 RepID=UPI00148D1CEE|nr:hypothetical protein [Enterocloster bolteae]QJU22647.1 hypothetical protein HLY09_26350 [Enterocloster bolteae]